jgi:hypothetical protein
MNWLRCFAVIIAELCRCVSTLGADRKSLAHACCSVTSATLASSWYTWNLDSRSSRRVRQKAATGGEREISQTRRIAAMDSSDAGVEMVPGGLSSELGLAPVRASWKAFRRSRHSFLRAKRSEREGEGERSK